MKRILVLLVAVVMSVGMAAPAEAASGLKRHRSSCEAMGYKTKLQSVPIRKDGFGGQVGEIRTMAKSKHSRKQCTYTKRTGGTPVSQLSAGVQVLVKSGHSYSYRSASSVRTGGKRSYSYTFTSLVGKKAVRNKTTLHLTGAVLTTDDGMWWDTAYTRVG